MHNPQCARAGCIPQPLPPLPLPQLPLRPPLPHKRISNNNTTQSNSQHGCQDPKWFVGKLHLALGTWVTYHDIFIELKQAFLNGVSERMCSHGTSEGCSEGCHEPTITQGSLTRIRWFHTGKQLGGSARSLTCTHSQSWWQGIGSSCLISDMSRAWGAGASEMLRLF